MKISSEHTLIHKELLRSTAVFFVVFALLLSVLGVFIYHQVHTVLFRETDAQLVQARENIQHDVEFLVDEGNELLLFRDAQEGNGIAARTESNVSPGSAQNAARDASSSTSSTSSTRSFVQERETTQGNTAARDNVPAQGSAAAQDSAAAERATRKQVASINTRSESASSAQASSGADVADSSVPNKEKKHKRHSHHSSGIQQAIEQDALFTSIIRATEHAIQNNSRLLFVVRDSDGKVLNAISLYTIFPQYVAELPLNSDFGATPYSLACDGHHLRGVTVTFARENSQNSYVQVLANVDSEMAILDSVTNTLIGGFLVALIIAAALSYILARRALKPLLQSWVKQTEFIQNASHELRTPLTIIKTTQELLLDKPNDKVIDHFENIAATIEEVDRLSHLSADLLFLTKFDSGANTLNKMKIELDSTLRFMAHLYRETVELQDKVFQFNAGSNCSIMADEKKIRQLIAIVLDNALKYTHEGDRIQVNSFREGHDAVIEVKDTGIGISKEDAKRAFERFYRADKARSEGGSGLGLAIAFSIVKAHGGKISIAPWTARASAGAGIRAGTGAGEVAASERESAHDGAGASTGAVNGASADEACPCAGVCDGEVSVEGINVYDGAGQESNDHASSSSSASEQSCQFQSGTCVRISFPQA